MGTALVAGVSALALALLSWLLANGSRRSRLLGRIERQVAVLKDLPDGHAARPGVDESLLRDVEELRRMSARPTTERSSGRLSPARTSSSRASYVAAALSALLAIGALFLGIMQSVVNYRQFTP